jgi:2-keto-4-pentenoate hydratase/2-oxohepta-3-ene-1,7-dioic acid hydratase in catechol pathway
MRLASFTAGGRDTFGLVVGDDGLTDLGRRTGGRYGDLRGLVASGELEAAAAEHGDQTIDYRFDDVRFLPPIPQPQHILLSGGNFPGHLKEMTEGGFIQGRPPWPGFHIKSSGSLVGHREPLVKPAISDQLDFENEFAAVIGKAGRRIPQERALEHVLGYACVNDGSVRDYQLERTPFIGKNFHRSSSFGPWIATRDETGDIRDIWVTTRLNGEVVQHEAVGTLIFPMEQLISYLSEFFHLQPGDVISAGSAGGVGFFRKPQLFMKAGDRVEFEVDRVGVMEHKVIDEA